jgi:hypothetical protein
MAIATPHPGRAIAIATHVYDRNATHVYDRNATHVYDRNISKPRKGFIGTRKTGYLRNCTILSKLLLGSGELASLAYGSFKELLKFKELVQREELIRGTDPSSRRPFETIRDGFEVIRSPTFIGSR